MLTEIEKRMTLSVLLNQVDEAVDQLNDPELTLISMSLRKAIMQRLEELSQAEGQARD